MKTICIYHSKDLDGGMSGAIVKKWFEESRNNFYMWDLNMNTHVLLEKSTAKPENVLHFLGWHYGDPIPDLSAYEEIIMCDISFPKEVMLSINKRLGLAFIWIDHHQRTIDEVNEYIIANGRPMEGLVTEEGELKAACELTWEYFFPEDKMPEIVRLLGRYDCFGHKGTDEEEKVLEFQYGARNFWSNYNECYDALVSWDEKQEHTVLMAGHHIYNYLCTEAKQTYALGFPLIFKEDIGPHDVMSGPLPRKFLCVNRNRFNP